MKTYQLIATFATEKERADCNELLCEAENGGVFDNAFNVQYEDCEQEDEV